MLKKEADFDLVVAGGGVSGLCAAVSASRMGLKTVLIHDRGVLGGNAGSEFRMHICGASRGGHIPDARETGIIEELLLENRYVNEDDSFAVFDIKMWEMAVREKNLSLFLNTKVIGCETENNKITIVKCLGLTNETEYIFSAGYFIDSTGDGFLGYCAGAEYRYGREASSEFDESLAPEQADLNVMGTSLLFVPERGKGKSRYIKPEWADNYSENDLKFRHHSCYTPGYWWIELGGSELNTIYNSNEIQKELYKALFGVWDHIKECHDPDSRAYIKWISTIAGKRESRRLIGDYILSQKDLLEIKYHDDDVAYGGWTIDLHVPGGIRTLNEEPTKHNETGIYGIPYRCLYSKNISNLFIAGRAISATHVAFGSTRVIATCAVIGQAVGAAAALCKEKNIQPHMLLKNIGLLQDVLIRQDCFIPNKLYPYGKIISEAHFNDIKTGKILTDGHIRNENGKKHCCTVNQPLEITFDSVQNIREIYLIFDSELSRDIAISMTEHKGRSYPGILPKKINIALYNKGNVIKTLSTDNNLIRNPRFIFNETLTDKIAVTVEETHSQKKSRLFLIDIR